MSCEFATRGIRGPRLALAAVSLQKYNADPDQNSYNFSGYGSLSYYNGTTKLNWKGKFNKEYL
jgi:hypothetical protein